MDALAMRRTPTTLLDYAVDPAALETIAIAGSIASARAHGVRSDRWLRGIDATEWSRMLDTLFPGASSQPEWQVQPDPTPDEFDDEYETLRLLLSEAVTPAEAADSAWLVSAVGSAALFDDHLWTDLQLPNRPALSQLLQARFPSLAARNTRNMRWKAFFYKQICDRAGLVCRSPSCGSCDEYEFCFGPE